MDFELLFLKQVYLSSCIWYVEAGALRGSEIVEIITARLTRRVGVNLLCRGELTYGDQSRSSGLVPLYVQNLMVLWVLGRV